MTDPQRHMRWRRAALGCIGAVAVLVAPTPLNAGARAGAALVLVAALIPAVMSHRGRRSR